MPAIGSARTTMFVSVVELTGFPAHAAMLTKTTKAIVPSHTSRFDHRCDTPILPAAVYVAFGLPVVFSRRVECESQCRLRGARRVLVAVERARLRRIYAYELAVLHLQPDEAGTAQL